MRVAEIIPDGARVNTGIGFGSVVEIINGPADCDEDAGMVM